MVPRRKVLSPRLLVDLLKRPRFIAALGVNVLGSVLQIAALHAGSLAVVQPLIVLNLLFAVVIAAFTIRNRPPDAIMLAGAVCCVAGVGALAHRAPQLEASGRARTRHPPPAGAPSPGCSPGGSFRSAGCSPKSIVSRYIRQLPRPGTFKR